MRVHPFATTAGLTLLLACANAPSQGGLGARRSEATVSAANVLFIGNSLTGTALAPGNLNMPQVLAQFASGRGKTLNYKEAYLFSHTLLESWQANIPEPLLTGATKWDFISMQEYSTLPVQNPDQFYATEVTTYQPAVLASLKPTTGRVILFENWAVTDPAPFATRAAYAAALEANYATLMSRLSEPTVLAPLSRAWEQVLTDKPQTYLFADDRHPNGNGIYLNACVYYAIIFHDTPVGLPNLYLPATDAAYLQAIASQLVPTGEGPDGGVAADGGAVLDAGGSDGAVDADAGGSPGGAVDADGGGSEVGASGPVMAAAGFGSTGGGCTSAGGAASCLSLVGIAVYVLRRRLARS